jgi:hypothetical protein
MSAPSPLRTDRAMLVDLLNRQLSRITALEREIAELMKFLDKREQRR